MSKSTKGLTEAQIMLRWNFVLLLLAVIGIVWLVFMIGYAFFINELNLGVPTTSGIKVLTQEDFTTTQRWLISLFTVLPNCCWVYAISQIVRLSRFISRGQMMSYGPVHCLQHFGYAMAVLAVIEAVSVPLLCAYLISLRKVEDVKNLWLLTIDSGAILSLMAAVLLIILAKILCHGISLQREAELTI